ncbi:MAG TPA: glycoside hydrolase family 19 protein [Parafilimonas sp.]|nr:glycoside hydrolase family 19 protein [Parafilimonas sp.]
MIVTANKLNRRSGPVSNIADKSNIIDVVTKGFSFDSISKINNAAGDWYEDSAQRYYWGGALSITEDAVPAPAVQPPLSVASGLSTAQIKAATLSTTTNAEKFASFINETCTKFQINTPIRALCFLAQVGHESGGLFFTEELASGSAYEGRSDLGNTQPGDGVRFKGRGLIQITGRANYTAISNDLGIDFVANPTLLGGKNANVCTTEQLKNAAMSAGWFWNSRNLNAIADKIDINKPIEDDANLDQFEAMTKKINGGTNGLPDRVARYKAGMQLFT